MAKTTTAIVTNNDNASSSSLPVAEHVVRFLEKERRRYENMPPESRLPCFLSVADKKKIVIYRNVEILVNRHFALLEKDRRQRYLIRKIADDFFSIFAQAERTEELVLIKRPQELRAKMKAVFDHHNGALLGLKARHRELSSALNESNEKVEELNSLAEKQKAEYSLCSSKLGSSFYENSVRVILQSIQIQKDKLELENKILRAKMASDEKKFELRLESMKDYKAKLETEKQQLKQSYERYLEIKRPSVLEVDKKQKRALIDKMRERIEEQLERNARYDEHKLVLDKLYQNIEQLRMQIKMCEMKKENERLKELRKNLEDSAETKRVEKQFKAMLPLLDAKKPEEKESKATKESALQEENNVINLLSELFIMFAP